MTDQQSQTCAKCGIKMDGPGDWGKCFDRIECLQRQVDDLKMRLGALTDD